MSTIMNHTVEFTVAQWEMEAVKKTVLPAEGSVTWPLGSASLNHH